MTAGDYRQVGDGRWADVTAMTAHGDHLYLVSRRGLYQIDPATDGYQPVGDEVWDVKLLAGAAGALFAIDESGTLFRVEPDGSYQELGEHATWARAQVAAGTDQDLYVIEGGGLYRAELATGGYQQIGTEPWEPRALVATPDLHVLNDDGTLYRVAVPDGEWTVVGEEREWASVTAAAAVGGRIYAVASAYLYAVDPATGAHASLSDENWDVSYLVGCRGKLYALTTDEGLYEIEVE